MSFAGLTVNTATGEQTWHSDSRWLGGWTPEDMP